MADCFYPNVGGLRIHGDHTRARLEYEDGRVEYVSVSARSRGRDSWTLKKLEKLARDGVKLSIAVVDGEDTLSPWFDFDPKHARGGSSPWRRLTGRGNAPGELPGVSTTWDGAELDPRLLGLVLDGISYGKSDGVAEGNAQQIDWLLSQEGGAEVVADALNGHSSGDESKRHRAGLAYRGLADLANGEDDTYLLYELTSASSLRAALQSLPEGFTDNLATAYLGDDSDPQQLNALLKYVEEDFDEIKYADTAEERGDYDPEGVEKAVKAAADPATSEKDLLNIITDNRMDFGDVEEVSDQTPEWEEYDSRDEDRVIETAGRLRDAQLAAAARLSPEGQRELAGWLVERANRDDFDLKYGREFGWEPLTASTRDLVGALTDEEALEKIKDIEELAYHVEKLPQASVLVLLDLVRAAIDADDALAWEKAGVPLEVALEYHRQNDTLSPAEMKSLYDEECAEVEAEDAKRSEYDSDEHALLEKHPELRTVLEAEERQRRLDRAVAKLRAGEGRTGERLDAVEVLARAGDDATGDAADGIYEALKFAAENDPDAAVREAAKKELSKYTVIEPVRLRPEDAEIWMEDADGNRVTRLDAAVTGGIRLRPEDAEIWMEDADGNRVTRLDAAVTGGIRLRPEDAEIWMEDADGNRVTRWETAKKETVEADRPDLFAMNGPGWILDRLLESNQQVLDEIEAYRKSDLISYDKEDRIKFENRVLAAEHLRSIKAATAALEAVASGDTRNFNGVFEDLGHAQGNLVDLGKNDWFNVVNIRSVRSEVHTYLVSATSALRRLERIPGKRS
jgi:hypothetical protein